MFNKFNLVVVFFLILVLAGCSSLDVAVSNKFNSQKKIEKIVVFPFQVEGAKCGSEFSDAVSHQFVKSERMEIVEREALDKLIEEDKLSLTGLIDESKATAIGKKLGVDAIILGRGTAEQIKNFNHIRSFSLRMISVETGTHIVTVRMAEGDNPKYDDLAKEMVPEILNAIDRVQQRREAREKAAEAKPIEVSGRQNEAAPAAAAEQEPKK